MKNSLSVRRLFSFLLVSFLLSSPLLAKEGYQQVEIKNNHVDSALRWNEKISYLFLGDQYVCHTSGVKKHTPKMIQVGWKGPWKSGFDAAFNFNGTYMYFFKGKHYVSYNPVKKVWGQPKLIKGNWKGVWEENIDAAVGNGKGGCYFFKGKYYVKWEKGQAGAPKPIKGNWAGVFPDGVDAAVRVSGYYFFFKGDKYVYYPKSAAPSNTEKGWGPLPLVTKKVWKKIEKPQLPKGPVRSSKSFVMLRGVKCFINTFEYEGKFNLYSVRQAIYKNYSKTKGIQASHQAGKFYTSCAEGKAFVVY